MQVSFNGKTSAFQADDGSSILLTCSSPSLGSHIHLHSPRSEAVPTQRARGQAKHLGYMGCIVTVTRLILLNCDSGFKSRSSHHIHPGDDVTG